MTLQKHLILAPLALMTTNAFAQENAQISPEFQLTAQVSRTVEKDLMSAVLFCEKQGKSLAEAKKGVASNLNALIDTAKKYPEIEILAEGISNHATYGKNGKVSGWNTYGSVAIKSKNFEAMAKVLENLGEEVGIQTVDFSISPEKTAQLEDEMTVEVIKQFQHKADVVKASLNAKGYQIKNMNLDTPFGERSYPLAASARTFKASDESMPLVADNATISTSASGTVVIEQ